MQVSIDAVFLLQDSVVDIKVPTFIPKKVSEVEYKVQVNLITIDI